ncbi:hypothetical protein LGI35_44910 (plasmid) [Streptomyces longhuiensis]|nr:hypothetical protein [Streptomyces longhuiensis]UDM05407.1 hypothetical protein LGI35_44910 [Streptomyces longhuiensis]
MQDGAVKGAAVAGDRVAAGRETVLEGFADLVAQRRQDVGGLRVGQVGRGHFQHQLPDRVRAGGEVVDQGAQRGERGIGRRILGRRVLGCRRRGRGADVVDGLTDHRAHGGLIQGRPAAVGERGEAAGDQLGDVAAAGGDSDQSTLGQAVVERGRGA